MPTLHALRQPPLPKNWKKGDVLVLFGELFSRGYANGLVDEAERVGMTVVRATVGRREKDGTLRALNAEEAAAVPQPFINIPLEAGFDLEPASNGKTPIDFIKDVKLSEWEKASLDAASLEESRTKAAERFRKNTALFMQQLAPHIPKGANVLFAHLMAGGVPRTKIVMPLINRVVKGTGDRYLPSEKMWTSPIGKFCAMNFREVTAETFRHLIEVSANLRGTIEGNGGHVSYLAYGYHGTEILIKGEYRWQTYTPYVQGWAKMDLENISERFKKQGLNTCVYNCPEILTNSSSIFQGVEVSLYPLLNAFRTTAPNHPQSKQILAKSAALLNGGEEAFDKMRDIANTYFTDAVIVDKCQFPKWPQHTTQVQLETMLKASDDMISLHKNEKELITAELSELVFEACGQLMLHDAWAPQGAVAWIGHDVIVKTIAP